MRPIRLASCGFETARPEAPVGFPEAHLDPNLQFHRRSQNWFGPIRNVLKITRVDNLTSPHMKEQFRLRGDVRMRICLVAIVENSKFREHWQELNQVQSALVVPFADLRIGNIVAAPGDPGAYACDVKFRAL